MALFSCNGFKRRRFVTISAKTIWVHALSASFCLAPLQAAAPQSLSQDELRRLFSQYVNDPLYVEDMEKRSLSGDSFQYYFLSYYLHGMISAFEVTQEEDLLKRILKLM